MKYLMNQLHNLANILTGVKELKEEGKYRFICYSISLIHVVITARFFLLNYTILYVYNFFVVLFYFGLGTFLVPRKKFYAVFLCCYVEIQFHSVMASLLAGWDWGFMIYTLALIPVSFYLAYALPEFNRSIKQPFYYTFVILVVFITARIISSNTTPIYTERVFDQNLTISYTFNALVAFVMLIFFSVLFIIEIRRNELQLERQNRQLEALSSKDPLTGLLNRRSMDKCLADAVELSKRKGSPFSIIIGDIDDFKKINDTYGHNVGDVVLTTVADTICSNVPENASVCRWGGEEILILVHERKTDALPIAEKIRSAISQTLTKAEDTSIHITMTFGVSEYTPGIAMTKLIASADDNLYKGKKDGKNQVVA